MKRHARKVLLGIIAISAIAFVWPHRVALLLQSMTRRVVWKVDTDRPVLALTFDDGPDPIYTPQVLDLLKASNVSATFFLIGERAARYPELVARICAEGHEIANHSGSTDRTLFVSPERFVSDLESAQTVIAAFPCAKRMFRPAGIWIRPSQVTSLRRLGYECVLGTAYGHDPQRPPSEYIAWVVGRALTPGAIIVLHDSGGDRSHTIQALPRIIEEARDQGLQFVPTSRLLTQANPSTERIAERR